MHNKPQNCYNIPIFGGVFGKRRGCAGVSGPKYYYDHRAGRLKRTGQGRLQSRHERLNAAEGERQSGGLGALLRFVRSLFRPRR